MKKTIPIFLAIILALSQVTPTLAIGTPLAIGAPPAIGTPPATSWNTWDITHPNATSSQIEIASTLAWAAGSGATWITISPNFGDAGKKTAKVTIEANTTANDRTGYISIVSLGGTKTVTVNQPAGSLANSAPMTDWSVWDMTRANAASSPISITSSLAWVARSAAAWITIWPNLGAAGTKAAKVTIDANTTTSDRTGYIRIVSQGGTKVITVNQPAVAPKVHPPAEPSVVETDLIILENLPEGNILEEAGDTKALSATVIPSDATINDTASGSRDTDVDIIYQNGKMNIVGEGASMITASTTNDISAIYTANALVEQSVTSIDISEPEGDHFNNTTYINVYCSGEEEHLEIPCPLGATPESKSIRIDDDWITGGFIRINEIGTDTNTIRIKISRNTTGEIRKGSFTSVFSVTYKVPITDFGLSTTGEKKEPEDGELTILLFSRRFVYTIIQEPFAELSKVEISPKVLNMTVGESKKLDLVFTPSNANYSSIGYYVYDMNGKRQEHFLGFCISVDEYGRITAQKEGEAIV
ncbi:MAG: BACON domain-containing protein, partial [Oscillospiraceae bacterium]|nr:BACON domain-containing protein [Oscillospiraceae bacterium]